MAGNPFAKYAAPAGDPVIAVDPYKQADEQRKNEDQARQARDEQRARDAADRAARGEQRSQAEFEGTGGPGTEGEKKIATLVTRVAGGLSDIQGVLKTAPDAARPGMIEGIRGDLSPGGLTGMVARSVAGPERRAVNDSQRDMLDALLTLGTGAAYAPEQLRAAVAAHFPQYGDSADEAKIKMQRLERVIEAAKANAGPSWDRVAPAIEPFMQSLSVGSGEADIKNAGAAASEEDGLYDPNIRVTADGPNPDNPDPRGSFFGAFGDFMDSAGTLGKQGISLGLSDEAAGIGGAISNVLKGSSVSEGYTTARDNERARIEDAREKLGWFGTGLELAGGGGAAKIKSGALSLGNFVRQGAGFGTVTGYGYGEGAQGSALSALAGAGGGAALGYAGGRVVNALTGRTAGPAAEQVALVEAGQRQNVPMRQPDIRPEMRGKFAAAEQSTSGGPVIRDAIASDRAAVEAARGNVSPGSAKDNFALGETAQGAVGRASTRMKTETTALYTRARKLAGDATVAPSETVQAIDSRIAELKASGETANASEVSVLEGIKSDLQKSGLTIDSLQAQRKGLRNRISGANMDPNRAEAGFMGILDTAGKELEKGLAANPTTARAASALSNANKSYAARATFRKEIAKQFVGTPNAPVTPERAAARFTSMASNKGDYNRFSRMLGELEPGEKSDLAATIAEGLGTKANGEFEYGKFLRDLEELNPRAARDLFGSEGMAALSDLKAIARAKSDTLAEKNASKTGGVVVRAVNRLQSVLLSAVGGTAGGVPGAVVGAAAGGALEKFSSQRAARMLLNPDFTKWLRNTPNSTTPNVINRHFTRLEQIAAKSSIPLFQQDAKALQQFLADAFAQSPTRAAAQGQQENDGR